MSAIVEYGVVLVRIKASALVLLLMCLAPDLIGDEVRSPMLGAPLDTETLGELPEHVYADGQGLPQGSGTAESGKPLYEQHCAQCHGNQGQGGRALELVGDRSLLDSEYPDRGIAVYWPNAPTLYEYIFRSMPPDRPASFKPDEMYSIVAYLLLLNALIPPDSVVDSELLSSLQMPNQAGFRTIGR